MIALSLNFRFENVISCVCGDSDSSLFSGFRFDYHGLLFGNSMLSSCFIGVNCSSYFFFSSSCLRNRNWASDNGLLKKQPLFVLFSLKALMALIDSPSFFELLVPRFTSATYWLTMKSVLMDLIGVNSMSDSSGVS